MVEGNTQIRQVATGRPFTLAVRELITELKQDDPLHPLTVVVPSNLAGLSLRRLLGSDRLDTELRLGPRGIANVSFSTPFQLASRLAAPQLAREGKRPLTTAILAAAVRHVLRTQPGRFRVVAEHVATETSLVRAYAELTELAPAQRKILAAEGSAQTKDLLGFIDAVSGHLAGTGIDSSASYHDEYAVFDIARQVVSAAVSGERLVFAGPFSQGAATLGFLAAAAGWFQCAHVVALTGDESVDAETLAQVAELSGRSPGPLRVERSRSTSLIPAADSDEEVRAVVREVISLAEAGESFDRMAVFYPVRSPYARTLREQFDAAEIPSAGPDHRTLGDSMAGRLLGRLLDLASPDTAGRDQRFQRDDVLALVAAAPVCGPDGRAVRSGPWENVSRKAGVVGGLDDWSSKLDQHAQSTIETIEDPLNAERAEGFHGSLRRELQIVGELSEFVLWLHQVTDPARIGPTWAERASWAADLLDTLLVPPNRRRSWPETEVNAVERIEVVLKRVGVLEALEPVAPWSAFARALEMELDVPAGSRGRFGTGVLVAPLAAGAGLDLDHVFVLGLSEGLCPRVIREDTLLPDDERTVVGSALPVRADRLREERRSFLLALGAGASSRTLVMPLGDHRNGRTRTASRWWVEALHGLGASASLTTSDWAESNVAELRQPASYVQALDNARARGVVSSKAELDLVAVRHQQLVVGEAHETANIDPVARRGLVMLRDRALGLNRFTGDLSGANVPAVIDGDSAISATRLETWAGCPRRYFFGHLLGLGVIEAPDQITEISALDRGSMWHSILEHFIAEALPGQPHAVAAPDSHWTDDDRRRLGAHADRFFGEYEAHGRTGRPLLWRIEKEKLQADLDGFIAADDELRAELNSLPDAVELAIGFGADGEPANPPALVELPDGRTLRLRGFADRVDRRRDGSPVVLDYKTGSYKMKNKALKAHLEEDPVVGGSKLQLGVYAEAARQRYKTERSGAYYWFTSGKGEFRRAGYEWTTDRRDRFRDVVQTIVDGIEGGDFPPNPGEFDTFFGRFDNCRYCDFDPICRLDRDDELERAIESGRLVGYVGMSQSESGQA